MKTLTLQSKAEQRHGASMVEMALVLPVFVGIVLGIVEFGRGMMVAQIVTNSAREATRIAVVDGSTNSQVETFLRDYLEKAVGTNASDVSVQITITAAPGNPNPGNSLENARSKDLIEIKVSVPFDKVSFAGGDYLEGKNLVAVSTMRHE